MKGLILALMLATMLAAGSASGGTLSDAVMAPGLLEDLRAGSSIRYAHSRHVPQATALTEQGMAPLDEVAQGVVELTVVPGDTGPRLLLSRGRDADETPRPVGEFPAGGSNPVLLFFLENTVRAMVAQTGGSPYYIRNRIREALAAAEVAGGPGTVVLHPFETDPNRARMGDFAGLSLSLSYDPAIPARILELKADTAAGGQGYTETLTLMPE
jgi:hypothetical protein